MDAMELQIEELKATLQCKEAELVEAKAQHSATAEQFSRTLEEKNNAIALLELRIKRLLLTVRGSRQERIDPDQLLLFSHEELQQLAIELEANQQLQDQPPAEPLIESTKDRKKKMRILGSFEVRRSPASVSRRRYP